MGENILNRVAVRRRTFDALLRWIARRPADQTLADRYAEYWHELWEAVDPETVLDAQGAPEAEQAWMAWACFDAATAGGTLADRFRVTCADAAAQAFLAAAGEAPMRAWLVIRRHNRELFAARSLPDGEMRVLRMGGVAAAPEEGAIIGGRFVADGPVPMLWGPAFVFPRTLVPLVRDALARIHDAWRRRRPDGSDLQFFREWGRLVHHWSVGAPTVDPAADARSVGASQHRAGAARASAG
jgi:hypothetical protein